MAKTLTAGKEWEKYLDDNCRASAGPRPVISGMRKLYWGMDAPVVKCGQYAYLVTEETYSYLERRLNG